MDVIDRRERSRFELAAEGDVAFAEYRREGDRILFTHTVVPSALEGRGIGSRLVRAALAQSRAEGLKVVPICSFVKAYIERHPEEQDLLAD